MITLGIDDPHETDGASTHMRAEVYKKYLLGVLVIVLALNYVDRLVLGLVLQELKGDLGLSDTQLGFLGGIAFAVFYSVAGIPIARWADRGNRVKIIAVTALLWSVTVALCGTARNFTQLLLIRIGVAVGEAGCIPPAHSLIADYFGRAERPRAVGIYMLGGALSVLIGYFAGGWLNEFYGWRATFVLLGLPGVGVAVLAWLTLREPRLERAQIGVGGTSLEAPEAWGAGGAPSRQPDILQVFQTLWGNSTFRHLLIAFSIASCFGYGIQQWQPAFFIRSYGLRTGELGTWFAAIWGVGGMIGMYLGGDWASRRAANNERLQLKVLAVVYAVFAVASAFIYLSPNRWLAFALMAVTAVGFSATAGPLFATIQTLVPPHMRATSVAVIYLFANLIGMGLGPLAAGAMSDGLRPLLGEESLRYALLGLCPGYLWAAWHLRRGSVSVMRDVAALHESAENACDPEGPMAAPSTE